MLPLARRAFRDASPSSSLPVPTALHCMSCTRSGQPGPTSGPLLVPGQPAPTWTFTSVLTSDTSYPERPLLTCKAHLHLPPGQQPHLLRCRVFTLLPCCLSLRTRHVSSVHRSHRRFCTSQTRTQAQGADAHSRSHSPPVGHAASVRDSQPLVSSETLTTLGSCF